MNKLTEKRRRRFKGQEGIGMPELVIVLLVVAILVVIALPQMMTSRELFRFSGMQRETVTLLREARQEAMAQRKPITFIYDDNQKRVVLYGGDFGIKGDAKNKVYRLGNSGVLAGDIRYGRPPFATSAALADGTNLTALTLGEVEITFQSDGSVLDSSNNPEDFAIFLFHRDHSGDTSFAVSILGAGGRTKLWRYSKGANSYVE